MLITRDANGLFMSVKEIYDLDLKADQIAAGKAFKSIGMQLSATTQNYEDDGIVPIYVDLQ